MTLTALIALFLQYKYPIVFIFTIAEGPVIMMLSGIMLRLDIVDFWPIYLVLIAADLVGDTFWYMMGYYFAHPITHKYGKYIGISQELIEKVREIFHKHPKKILFTSKITMGLGFPQVPLLLAGMTRIPYKKFISILCLGQFIWTGMLIAIGYYFGDVLTKVNKDLRYIYLILFIVVAFLVLNGIQSYLKKRDIMNIGKTD